FPLTAQTFSHSPQISTHPKRLSFQFYVFLKIGTRCAAVLFVRCCIHLAWLGSPPNERADRDPDSFGPMTPSRSHTAPIQDHIDIDRAIDDLLGINRAPRCGSTETGGVG